MSCKEVLKSKNNSYTNTKHDSFNFYFCLLVFFNPKNSGQKMQLQIKQFCEILERCFKERNTSVI